MDFLNNREGGKVFYQVFLLSPLLCMVTEPVEIGKRLCGFKEIHKRLGDYEEIEISRQSCRVHCE
jgi:hypothetical protein